MGNGSRSHRSRGTTRVSRGVEPNAHAPFERANIAWVGPRQRKLREQRLGEGKVSGARRARRQMCIDLRPSRGIQLAVKEIPEPFDRGKALDGSGGYTSERVVRWHVCFRFRYASMR